MGNIQLLSRFYDAIESIREVMLSRYTVYIGLKKATKHLFNYPAEIQYPDSFNDILRFMSGIS